ncbi:TPA: hypothetical protein OW314_000483 [Pseudomonas aeruginosa]|uniref:hypothetical protein n=1 Tax=Pseudomonas aeruginosa TaxID=287 RepID=UPI001C3E90E6|nr:hypothetical protein [Pseudomonas aeruginosa]EKW7733843.1 hypothetical protein [Pseudomonas aeruginosa]MBV6202021.1 hypothetical protein [Pseudomonas aeruginosa]MDP5741689.1 hypothetical protein [Pseudomonas aeruginosa]HBN8189547.1 hypothetical protein [Pseudomonas aeruginosa]HCE6018637.1 hypothetical protein [Pseudomonas aeruginosa]
MKQLLDSVWMRRGTSWIWDAEALAQVCTASEVWSLRQFMQAARNWPDDLPSNDNNTLVVAGLEGSLDVLPPDEAEDWLAAEVKGALLSFQSYYEGQAALVFWMPSGAGRLTTNQATDAVAWRCAHPHSQASLDFGRVLWGEATDYPQEILLRQGAKASGLFHLRIT